MNPAMQKNLSSSEAQTAGVGKHAGRPLIGRPHTVPSHEASLGRD